MSDIFWNQRQKRLGSTALETEFKGTRSHNLKHEGMTLKVLETEFKGTSSHNLRHKGMNLKAQGT